MIGVELEWVGNEELLPGKVDRGVPRIPLAGAQVLNEAQNRRVAPKDPVATAMLEAITALIRGSDREPITGLGQEIVRGADSARIGVGLVHGSARHQPGCQARHSATQNAEAGTRHQGLLER